LPPALPGRAAPMPRPALRVTPDVLDTLRVTPLLGRTFSAEEGRTRARVVLISWQLWKTQLHGDPDIVGKTIPLDGEPNVVIGVMRPDFEYPINSEPSQIYRLYPYNKEDLHQNENRGSHFLKAIGRLKPGTTVAQAQADLETVAASIRADHPKEEEDQYFGIRARSLREVLVERVQPALVTLLVAVA